MEDLAQKFKSFYVHRALRQPAKPSAAIGAGSRGRAILSKIMSIPFDHFLTKQEPISWVVEHPEPKERHTKFDHLNVRLYGPWWLRCQERAGKLVSSRSAKD